MATKFNFFIHNLAQRFSGVPANDEAILSFSAKAYSLKQDGRIQEASIFTYHKRYNPDKYYVSDVASWSSIVQWEVRWIQVQGCDHCRCVIVSVA